MQIQRKGLKEKGTTDMTKKTITLSRQQLYDEIWQVSVAGVARKYNLNYPKLIAKCKEVNIPFIVIVGGDMMDELERNFLDEVINMRLEIAYKRKLKTRSHEVAKKEITRDGVV